MPFFSRKDNKNSTKHRFGMNHLRSLFSTHYQPAMQEQQPLMASSEATDFHRYNTLASLEGRAASNRSSEWFDWIDQIHEEKKEEEQQPQGSGILHACLSPLQLDKPLPPTPPAPPVPPKDNNKNNSNGRPLPPTPSPPPVPPKDPRRRYTKPLPPLPLSYTKRPLPPTPQVPPKDPRRYMKPLPSTPPKPQVPPKDF